MKKLFKIGFVFAVIAMALFSTKPAHASVVNICLKQAMQCFPDDYGCMQDTFADCMTVMGADESD